MAVGSGYTGKILRIDLASGKTFDVPTSEYSDKFLGGRGIAAKIYWDEISSHIQALSAENKIIIMTGPLAGFPSVGGSRWQVSGKSPFGHREHCSYSNLGGGWGARLKLAGCDGLIIEGKADKPVYILIEGGEARIGDATFLWGKGTFESRELLKSRLGNASTLTIGPAGENGVNIATILADNDSSGSAGMGAVMGFKKLKAIAVKGSKKLAPANAEKFSQIVKHFIYLRNYPTSLPKGVDHSLVGPKLRKDFCFGCVVGCNRAVYHAENGKKGKFMCQAASFYDRFALDYYGKVTEAPFFATRLSNDYGLCTKALLPMINLLNLCYQNGVITEKDTGLPLSQIGSTEYIERLLKLIAYKEGFGKSLAGGAVRAVQSIGHGARELLSSNVHRSGDSAEYGPRLYLQTALLQATEPARAAIGQLHEVGLYFHRWLAWLRKEQGARISTDILKDIMIRFWGGEEAADFTTYKGKSLAARKIQDRQYAKETLILCDLLGPIYAVDNIKAAPGTPFLETEILSAITGKHMNEEEFYSLGERIFNLQRAILLREGHRGREDDTIPEFCFTSPLKGEHSNPECLVPGPNGEVISRKGQVVDRGMFEKMKDEYYELRGWDIKTGIPDKHKLEELGLREISFHKMS